MCILYTIHLSVEVGCKKTLITVQRIQWHEICSLCHGIVNSSVLRYKNVTIGHWSCQTREVEGGGKEGGREGGKVGHLEPDYTVAEEYRGQAAQLYVFFM